VKYLQILNAAVLVLGAMMAIILAVVCLQYTVYVDSAPHLRDQLPRLFAITGLFAGLGAAGALAFFGHRRRWLARWLLQALPLLPVAGLGLFVASLRT
jgi:hypothetical protein